MDESKIVALLVRGDAYKDIRAELAREGIKVSDTVIRRVKTSNLALIESMKLKLIEKRATTATALLDKSRNLMDRRLNRLEEAEDIKQSAWARWQRGDITGQEYLDQIRELPDVTIQELNSISREAFSQSQIESGRPTSITANSAEAQQSMTKLVEAIKSGDEVELQRIIFTKQ